MSKPKDSIIPKQVKIAFIGDSGVGKSSLINYSIEDEYVTNNEQTNLIDIVFKRIELNESNILIFAMWDFSGRADSIKIRTELYPELQAIAYCFDLSNKTSFQNLEVWIKEVKKAGGERLIPICLGLKCDKAKVVDLNAIQQFTQKYKMSYLEISVKDISTVKKFYFEFGGVLYDMVKSNKK